MKNSLHTIATVIPEYREDISNLKVEAREYADKKEKIPSIWPVKDGGEGYISSEFGWRDHPITGENNFHEGIDIAVWYETPVVATGTGKVTFTGWKSGYGKTVDIDHGFGYSTRYAHLGKIKVDKNQKVEKGEVIALSGNTGRSTGPHLHYEVKSDGELKNPKSYLGGN